MLCIECRRRLFTDWIRLYRLDFGQVLGCHASFPTDLVSSLRGVSYCKPRCNEITDLFLHHFKRELELYPYDMPF